MTERRVEPPPWREVFQGPRGRLVTGLLVLEAIVAVYGLVVTAIMPAVRADLGGTGQYGFVFAVWALATVATIPIAGHAADRFGPSRPLLLAMFVHVCGLAVSGLAPTIAVLIAGVFLQGAAGGAYYALSLGTVAKTFPEAVRARVLALLATMWILPGLIGPALGAFIAVNWGWRWAFALPIPLLAICASLVLPTLKGIHPDVDAAALPIRWSVQCALGMALVLGGLTAVNLWSVPVVVAGLAFGLPALRHVVPSGTLRARPGMPAAAAAMFLLSMAFFTADTFIPLMLRSVRHLSLGRASLVITAATVTWSAGSWWQSRVAQRIPAGRLVTIGASIIAAGMAGVAIGLTDAPSMIVYVGWGSAGVGMGIAFPTLPLAVMGVAEEGKEAGQLSSILLMDTLGAAIGTGLGGACVAIATANGDGGLRSGIAGAYAIGFAAIIALLLVARRLPARGH